MPICIGCNQDMEHDPNECDICGEPIHRKCHKSGCPSCQESQERNLARAQFAGIKVEIIKPEKPAEKKPNKTALRPRKEEEKVTVQKKPGKKFTKQLESQPGGEITYLQGTFKIIRGANCPRGGIVVKFKVFYTGDPDGFRGFGNTKEEALADLEFRVSGKGQ